MGAGILAPLVGVFLIGIINSSKFHPVVIHHATEDAVPFGPISDDRWSAAAQL